MSTPTLQACFSTCSRPSASSSTWKIFSAMPPGNRRHRGVGRGGVSNSTTHFASVHNFIRPSPPAPVTATSCAATSHPCRQVILSGDIYNSSPVCVAPNLRLQVRGEISANCAELDHARVWRLRLSKNVRKSSGSGSRHHLPRPRTGTAPDRRSASSLRCYALMT